MRYNSFVYPIDQVTFARACMLYSFPAKEFPPTYLHAAYNRYPAMCAMQSWSSVGDTQPCVLCKAGLV